MKRLKIAIAICLLVALLLSSSFASNSAIMDDGKLLTNELTEFVAQTAQTLKEDAGVDLVFMTFSGSTASPGNLMQTQLNRMNAGEKALIAGIADGKVYVVAGEKISKRINSAYLKSVQSEFDDIVENKSYDAAIMFFVASIAEQTCLAFGIKNSKLVSGNGYTASSSTAKPKRDFTPMIISVVLVVMFALMRRLSKKKKPDDSNSEAVVFRSRKRGNADPHHYKNSAAYKRRFKRK